MPFLNIPNSQLSSVTSVLLGNIKSKLRVQVKRQLDLLKEEVLQNCDNKDRLQQLSSTLSNISALVLKLEKTTSKIQNIVQPLTVVLNSFNLVLSAIRLLPTPAPISVVENLNRVKEFVRQIDIEVTIILSIVSGGISSKTSNILNTVQTLKLQIQQLDSSIKSCMETGTIPEQVQEQKTFVKEDVFYHTSPSNNTYSIEVVVVDSDDVAPLRQAIAKDRLGIIRFTSDRSYSSSTQVLVDEVVFKIDNNIL